MKLLLSKIKKSGITGKIASNTINLGMDHVSYFAGRPAVVRELLDYSKMLGNWVRSPSRWGPTARPELSSWPRNFKKTEEIETRTSPILQLDEEELR